MDTNDHVVTNLQSCLLHVLMFAFLLLKWTNKAEQRNICLHVRMYMEAE